MPIKENWTRRVHRPVFLTALIALGAELAIERALDYPSASPDTDRLRLLALAALIPAAVFIVALVRLVRRTDELQRKICLDAVFIAFVATLALTVVFSGLQHAGVYQPEWSAGGSTVMALWAAAYLYSSRRYR